MTKIKSIDVRAHEYINVIGRQHWANAFIEGQRYDMLTKNIAENTNNLLKEIRGLNRVDTGKTDEILPDLA